MKRHELLKRAVHVAVTQPCVVVRVWGSSYTHCRKLFFEVRDMLPTPAVELQASDGRIVLSNQSEIRIANGMRAQVYRGESTVVEAVMIPEWVEEVARPCLFDRGGELLVESDD